MRDCVSLGAHVVYISHCLGHNQPSTSCHYHLSGNSSFSLTLEQLVLLLFQFWNSETNFHTICHAWCQAFSRVVTCTYIECCIQHHCSYKTHADLIKTHLWHTALALWSPTSLWMHLINTSWANSWHTQLASCASLSRQLSDMWKRKIGCLVWTICHTAKKGPLSGSVSWTYSTNRSLEHHCLNYLFLDGKMQQRLQRWNATVPTLQTVICMLTCWLPHSLSGVPFPVPACPLGRVCAFVWIAWVAIHWARLWYRRACSQVFQVGWGGDCHCEGQV